MPDFVGSMLRAVLNMGGAWIVAQGIADQSTTTAAVGGVVAVVGVSWSVFKYFFSKKKTV